MSSTDNDNSHKQSLNDQLKAKYRLNSEPFGVMSSFFYQGAQRQHNLETLRHLVSFGDMVLVVTGEAGSGKTVLVNELCRQSADDLSVLNLKPSLIDSPRKLVDELYKKFDLAPIEGEQPPRALDRLVQHCSQNSTGAKRSLIIVDDAQKLSKDTLRLLVSTFKELGSGAGVGLLVAGRPDVMKYLTSEGVDPLHCGWMHQIQLKPFSQDEAITYVSLRLIRAGATSELELTESQRKALHELGKGCPGRINRIAPGVLLDAFVSPELKKVPVKSGSLLLFGIAAALLLSFVVIGYQYGLIGLSENDVALEVVADNRVEGGDELLVESDIVVGGEVSERFASGQSVEVVSTVESDEVSTTVAMVSGDDVKRVELDIESTGFLAESSVSHAQSAETNGGLSPVSVVEEALADSDTPSPVIVVSDVKKAAVEEREQDEVAESKLGAPVKALPETVDNKRHVQFRSVSWVEKQMATSFTIQVLGSRSEATAIKYINAQRKKATLLYVESVYKNKPWYVVITGVYPSKTEARKALESLPKAIKRQKPWIRSIKGL